MGAVGRGRVVRAANGGARAARLENGNDTGGIGGTAGLTTGAGMNSGAGTRAGGELVDTTSRGTAEAEGVVVDVARMMGAR